MIVRLTKMIVNNIPLKFDPFITEIPDAEFHWDGGYDFIENKLVDLFHDEMWEKGIDADEVDLFEFAWDHEYSITSA